MNRDVSYVSEEWLRAYAYERGKNSEDDAAVGADPDLRLAEARVTLLEWRGHRLAESSDPETDLFARWKALMMPD